MKHLQFDFKTEHTFSGSITNHSFSLRCLPFTDSRQTISETRYIVTPSESLWNSRDSFGNQLLCGRISAEHNSLMFNVVCDAYVKNTDRICGTAETFFRFPSAMTVPGNGITAFYRSIPFSSSDTVKRALLISELLSGHMKYERGFTDVSTDAETAFMLGKGVCQDYVHVFLALLRLDGICCRYVSGLAFESGETHAWAEFHNGEQWVAFDPTNNIPVTDNYIKFCHGRDYSDCPIERGIYLGGFGGSLSVSSKVTTL